MLTGIVCLALSAYCKEHKTGEGLGVRVVIAAGRPGVVSLGCPLDPPHLQVSTAPEGHALVGLEECIQFVFLCERSYIVPVKYQATISIFSLIILYLGISGHLK